jgi:hypothetical protein
MGMSFLCRIGLHRWSYSTQLLDEPGDRTHTEIILARCTRHGCARYGAWSLVHREAQVAGASAPDSPASLA